MYDVSLFNILKIAWIVSYSASLFSSLRIMAQGYARRPLVCEMKELHLHHLPTMGREKRDNLLEKISGDRSDSNH